VVDFGVPGSLDDVRAQIREAAVALDRREAGEAAVAQFDAGLPPAPSGGPRPVAVVYQPNGATVGPGSLINSLLEAAGFDNLALKLGLDNYGRLPLDVLIAGRPDLLVVGELREGASLAEAMTRHAALGRYWRDRAVLEMPQSLWICGGPFTSQAAALLAAWRKAR
jgi:iron complex transport system substrate-binding protein